MHAYCICAHTNKNKVLGDASSGGDRAGLMVKIGRKMLCRHLFIYPECTVAM